MSFPTLEAIAAGIHHLIAAEVSPSAPTFLAMKISGIDDKSHKAFGSSDHMRGAFFNRFLSLPNDEYINPFTGTRHNRSYPHGSQYTPAREIRKPRWRNALLWRAEAKRGEKDVGLRFAPDYVDTLGKTDGLLEKGRKIPFWPLAAICAARSPDKESGSTGKEILEFWAKEFHLTKEERKVLFDMELDSDFTLQAECPAQSEIDKLLIKIFHSSDRKDDSLSSIPSNIKLVSTADDIQMPLNLIIYGPPGTGKTRELIQDIFPLFRDADGSERFVFTTFHPSYYYEDFIEGLKPSTEPLEEGSAQYDIVDGVFKAIALRAEADPEVPYAIIIDEINRGKIDALFGDVISLLEIDKRGTLSTTLPYSKIKFSVPPNLYIIGAMNTADKSISALDIALRRRFEFRELAPSSAALLQMLKAKGIVDGSVDGVDLPKMLDAINSRLRRRTDEGKLIGHGWFAGVASIDDLKRCFSRKIFPLLQEYFYDDKSEIELVLKDNAIKPSGFFTVAVDSDGTGEQHLLSSSELWTAEMFKNIYAGSVKSSGEL
ncbi:AAA family ATPase [Neorhizobium sp. JUb45]|uniref:McrB family protein n=1 Tax=Neorhizobium sp. JUb45 TaxID=2485113 RepID=UPI0010479D99|nr:AAA family ATPase [Neorhizobium sp. JUb45]TCQ99024.1 dynein-related subfamily AAA family protein [Neorhizobium sp. JUb45]